MSVPTAVAWQPWAAATFARAKTERRLLLVNVAAAWCHWCHVMDARTFSDARVAALLRDRFTCIRVDADARPDLAERYAEWGWPADAILTPDAQPVLELRGFQEPDGFHDLLAGLVRDLDAGDLRGRQPPPPPKASRKGLRTLRDLVQGRLDAYYDERLGGWGRFQKYPFAAPVEQAFLRAQRGEEGWMERALKTLEGTRHLIDPVWGGAFQYSVNDRWDDPHFEKIAVIQAGTLDNFAQAYHLTNDPAWLEAARQIASYLVNFLRDPTGAFWTSQDADVQDGKTPTKGSDYYALPDKKRRKLGLPRTDRNVYADWNGLLITALLRLHAATGEAPFLALAQQATDALLQTHRTKQGAFRHAAQDATGIIHLRDNAAMGRALLALFEATGDKAYHQAARQVAKALQGLEADDGGLYAHSPDADAAGTFTKPRRPLEENGMAMRFLVELRWLDGDAGWQRIAERAARALAHEDLVRAEGRILGHFLLGIEWLLAEPLKLDVVGDPADPVARLLHTGSRAIRRWPRLVLWQRPGASYPATGGPAVYLCQGSACSSPVRQAEALHAAAERLA